MTSYTAIFLFLFNKGQTHKTKGEGQQALQGDAGTLVLGYWLRSIIYKHTGSVPLSTNRLLYHIILSIPLLLVDDFFEINKMLKYFVIAEE